MSKRHFRLPSPALVISMLALALALGGSAVAAATGGNTAQETKLIKKLAPTLSVKHAKSADSVGGQSFKSFERTVATGDSTQEQVLSFDGLTLSLSCATGEPIVEATGSSAGALLRGTTTSAGNGGDTTGQSQVDAGESIEVFSAADERGTLDLHYLTTAGHHVDVSAVVDDHDTINDYNGCLLEGYAVAG